ncbi:uncharacterized protein LOC123269308 [Cotesia glomerata]|uniref:Uncharacterized protein n=1 Tax=Cotesia glomerata TaxID=32391 RepID=A0AAV7IAX0_COTGL|nr:uncharacterized protein LOC123269308 [Cotesia glomerata]KAH0547231.1 hypothetical protein KQX54_017772 [Cotesia glomerata]
MEYLIPFLLTAQYAVNDLSTYYMPEYQFKFTKSWERTFENGTIGHGNVVTVLRCQNSSMTSIICAVKNCQLRTYTEVPDGTTKPENPKYVQDMGENNELGRPFEIVFDQNGVKQLVTDRRTTEVTHGSWWEIANRFNVLWVKNLELDDHLISKSESTIYGKCLATIKAKEDKLRDYFGKSDGFKIDIEKGFQGMQFLYEKTRDTSSCEERIKVLGSRSNFFVVALLEVAKSRVILSETEFFSMYEDQVTYLLMGKTKIVNHHKMNMVLTGIEQAVDKITPVKNPAIKLFKPE